jgi:1-deoxy-D-xylulose-5-phosphate synthase
MCWEALNNISAAPDRPVIIVLNDNGRSYAPTIGGLAQHLTTLRHTNTDQRSAPGLRVAAPRDPAHLRELLIAEAATLEFARINSTHHAGARTGRDLG